MSSCSRASIAGVTSRAGCSATPCFLSFSALPGPDHGGINFRGVPLLLLSAAVLVPPHVTGGEQGATPQRNKVPLTTRSRPDLAQFAAQRWTADWRCPRMPGLNASGTPRSRPPVLVEELLMPETRVVVLVRSKHVLIATLPVPCMAWRRRLDEKIPAHRLHITVHAQCSAFGSMAERTLTKRALIMPK